MGPAGRGTGLLIAADPVSTLSAPHAVWAMLPAVDISEEAVPDIAAGLDSGEWCVPGGCPW
jgi:6-phosphogluconate dehydrogenase (decarboxylating)